MCDTSSSQDKTSRWRCDAMVTRVSDQLRRPSGFQSFTWAHSSILYTGTPVQYTLYNTHVLHCTPYSCILLVSFSANFLVKKIQWDQFVTSSLKMFFLPWQQASFCWLCWFSNVNVSKRLFITVHITTHSSFYIFFLWIKVDIRYIYRQAKSQRNKPFMVIVLLSTLSLESQM